MDTTIGTELRSIMGEPKMGNWIENDRDELKIFPHHTDCIKVEGRIALLSLIGKLRKRGA